MNRKIFRIVLSCIILFMFLFNFNMLESLAANGSEITDTFTGIDTGDISDTDIADSENIINKVIGTVLSAVRIVAIGISIIMITYLGIKYMAAAPSEKASIKNQLVAFVIGAGIVFGATAILGIAVTVANSIF